MEVEDKVVSSESEAQSHELIKNKLIAIGANSASGSYDESHKKALEGFLSMPLKAISPTWNFLRSDLKVRVIDSHKEEFDRFISSSEEL